MLTAWPRERLVKELKREAEANAALRRRVLQLEEEVFWLKVPAAQAQAWRTPAREREVFESAARDIGWPDRAFALDGAGNYLTRYTDYSWQLWQKCAALAQENPP
jgi:hypothetical protein